MNAPTAQLAWAWQSSTWLVQADAAASTAADTTDATLAQRGDHDAFARLIRRHQRDVARLMWRFSRDPSEHEELVQDVFVAAFASLGSYNARGPFGAWLRQIAVRTGYACWRRRGRDRIEFRDDVGELLDEAASQRGPDSAAAVAEVVHRLLARLGERDRLVLTLLHLEGLSVVEIAAATGWSVALVKVQAWRARGRLRKLMEEAS